MRTPREFLRSLSQYPSVAVSTFMILALLGLSIYAVIAIPYGRASLLWRGGEEVWYMNPRQAAPAWLNLFSSKKQPVSFDLKTGDTPAVTRTAATAADGKTEAQITFTFDYAYDYFPQEVMLYFTSVFQKKQPFADVMWVMPDGREIRITNLALSSRDTYRFTQDARLQRLLRGKPAMEGLFVDPSAQPAAPMKGIYKLIVTTYTFEKDASVDVEMVLHGNLSGWAGTDHLRRDLGIALLWGTPIALAFGLLGALGTTLTTIAIAAVGSWYRGWIEEIIQRITEVNLLLPFLSILIMIGTFYSRSIWVILGATILLSIFGAGIKTYRAVFMQIMETSYIEAARSYGASDARVIFRYMVPRVIPTLIPQLVTLIPFYVFLEATLAVLGLGDPILPTWGKVINDAASNSALFGGQYYWVLEPAGLLMFTGLAFALLGFSLDRIFNPRLREA